MGVKPLVIYASPEKLAEPDVVWTADLRQNAEPATTARSGIYLVGACPTLMRSILMKQAFTAATSGSAVGDGT